MARKRRYLTATMPDGYVKTIGPTTDSFTHYWRIVATLASGKTEVFWGHTRSLAEARRKRLALAEAEKMRVGENSPSKSSTSLKRRLNPPTYQSFQAPHHPAGTCPWFIEQG